MPTGDSEGIYRFLFNLKNGNDDDSSNLLWRLQPHQPYNIKSTIMLSIWCVCVCVCMCSLISQFFFVNGVCKRCKVKNRLYNRSQNQSRRAHERNYYLQKKWVHCFVQLTSNSSPCHHPHRQNTRTFKMINLSCQKK